ncbi:Translin [Geranomyces variabilis]|nr:Translin [Geranomyces variabilis]
MADIQATPKYFEEIQTAFDADCERRDAIRQASRDLEKLTRSFAASLNRVHVSGQQSSLNFDEIRTGLSKLAELVPVGEFYRYNSLFSFVLQQAVFLVAHAIFLQNERLATLTEIENELGVKINLRGDDPAFHIGVEDLLSGLSLVPGELSRLAVNCVISGDFARPFRISKFVSELYAGFQLLNFKNDNLRKRFDGIKYDIKKIEEVVYDISVRGLAAKPTPESVS